MYQKKMISRKKDLQIHLITGIVGFFLFLYVAGHGQPILGAILWYGPMLLYHFGVRKQCWIKYKQGVWDPGVRKWVRT